MKVQIGKRAVRNIDTTSAINLKQIEDQIGQDLIEAVAVETVEVSEPWLRRLAEEAKEAAIKEAARMFDVIANIIEKPNKLSLTARDFPSARGMVDRTLSPVLSSGSVPWQDYSMSHIMRKQRDYPQNTPKMFKYSGYLQAYFRAFGREIVTSKFGGVEVKVNPSMLYNRSYGTVDIDDAPGRLRGELFQNKRLKDTKRWRSLESLLLGSVTLEIFPKISPMLLPMLASNRWTDTGNGELERKMFGNTGIGRKLINRNRPYRPLVTPTVQYWMALQVPDAIFRRVNERFKRSDVQVSRFLNG